MNNKLKRIFTEFIFFAVLIFMDQYTKKLAVDFLKDKPAVDIIKGVLELYYLPNGNTGAAFGMLAGHQSFFVVIALVVVLVIGYILYNMPFDKKYTIMSVLLVFIASGGIGNMIDRFRQAFVVDFIYFSIINFPIFNVADIYVSVSTVLLALYLLFKLKEDDFKIIEDSLKAPFVKR